MRALLSVVTYPALLIGSWLAGAWLLPRYGADAAVGLCGAGAVLCVAVLERVHPFRPEFNRSHGDLGADIVHNVVSGLLVPRMIEVLCFGAIHRVGAWLATRLDHGLWPDDWPVIAQVALALLIAELPSYGFHRLEHERPLWWRIHATHHSAPRLYWLNAARFHPADGALSYAVLLFPLVLLGAPADTLAMFTVFLTTHGLLQHANIELRHGPLNWLFSTAELHRWHHAPDAERANHNYGTVLAVWDVLFGTRYLPGEPDAPESVGIADLPDFPSDYLGQLASPWLWKKIGGARATGAPTPPENE